MGDSYVGEIRLFAGNFAPAGWAFCNGAVVSIAENDTLFNLIGTTYGGDGQETFALPDLRGRVPIHQGLGPGMGANYVIGEQGGVEQVTLTPNQIPSHTHALLASTDAGTQPTPSGSVPAANNAVKLYSSAAPAAAMAPSALGSAGGNQPHDNMQPSLCLSFIISLYGIYPSPT